MLSRITGDGTDLSTFGDGNASLLTNGFVPPAIQRKGNTLEENGKITVDRGGHDSLSRSYNGGNELTSIQEAYDTDEETDSCAVENDRSLLLRTTNTSYTAGGSRSLKLTPFSDLLDYQHDSIHSPSSSNLSRSTLTNSSPSLLLLSAPSQCMASTGESSYDIPPVDSGINLLPPSFLTSEARGTQIEEREGRQGYAPSHSREGQEERPASLTQQKLQSKIEALRLSNELMNTSLDDARKQVVVLQSTVAEQREEIRAKEGQITTINGRVTALLRGMESTDSSNQQYKELYHKSVLQNSMLQSQLNKFSHMSSGMQSFLSVHEKMTNQLMSNKRLLDFWRQDVERRERNCLEKVKEVAFMKSAHQEMMKDCHLIKQSNDQLTTLINILTCELGKHLAKQAITSARLIITEEGAHKINESVKAQNHDLQGKLAHLLDTFKRTKDEYQESSEFSEMERQMLLESNTELEREVEGLKKELKEGEEEFQKLVNYIKQYQEETKEKTDVLKNNLMKADKEIEQLDKLMEQVKKVMTDNLPYVRRSKPLLNLQRILTGSVES